ncbi:MAG: threonine synthase [Spirochaetaceae bacterium]|jgi:threonine synthase|nr:threonine synthase [Spirochaetaceae bacterium]
MEYYSTRDRNTAVSFAAAALAGLAPDGGLYIPGEIPRFPAAVISSLGAMRFADIALETIRPWVADDIPPVQLADLVESAFPFTAPLVAAGNRRVLELFHGPTAAFKDFGARFMARAFSYFRRGEDRPLHILVATSGDTGGAVADGFFGVEGISVTVLYPKGRVTPLQEKQIAGRGGNISAAAVEGSFDDCQALVKAAFADSELKRRLALSSANSINVARLVPQIVYYAASSGRAFAGCVDPDGPATPRAGGGFPGEERNAEGREGIVVVPSGNFGNLTAGLYAKKMGAPIDFFVAATNINKTVPDYLESGSYTARPSQETLSNAMDVGAPSNFERMAAHWSWEDLRGLVRGVPVTDDETRTAIETVYREHRYYLDPHGAVGWQAADKLRGLLSAASPVVVLATAHPAKFPETVEPITGPVPVPGVLAEVMGREVCAAVIPPRLDALRELL